MIHPPTPLILGALVLLNSGPARATGADVSTLFECHMGAVRNPEAAPEAWTSDEATPFALLVKREPGSNFAGRDQSLLTVDPARLLPIEPAYSIGWRWPSRVAVVGSSSTQPLSTFVTRGRTTEKVPTFSTLRLDVQAKTARATIVKVDGAGNADLTGAVVGSCRIELGDPAVVRFQELRK
jgi:hypothetical protein